VARELRGKARELKQTATAIRASCDAATVALSTQIGRSGDGGGALMGRSASGVHRQSDASATRKSKA